MISVLFLIRYTGDNIYGVDTLDPKKSMDIAFGPAIRKSQL